MNRRIMKDYREDFERWARDCVRITDKLTGRPVPFRLNAPQRRVLGVLEEMRRGGEPIRLIMLKARQWGGSTLVQTYMAWMQLVRRKGWNSLICAHVKDASAQIRGMYSQLLREYPEGMKAGEARDWAFVPYEKSQSVCWIPAREAQVAIATSLSPNTVRGSNFAMAHLSEVAFWADGDERVASEIVRTVSGSVAREPDTLVVMESTANGTDNYFCREWRRAVAGKSDKRAVFVPWHEIEIYRKELAEEERAAAEASLDDYERGLLADGVELERVAWYHEKRREYATHEAMMAESPSTAEEAFANAGCGSLLAEGQVAPLAERPGAPADGGALGVLLVSGDGQGQLLSFFADVDGRFTPLVDERLDGLTPGRAVAEAAARCRGKGARLVVAEAVRPDGPGHARRCARRAAMLGVPMAYDEDERPYVVFDAVSLADCGDVYAGLSEDGQAVETDAEARQELLRCSRLRPWATPLALTRLAAARFMAEGSPRVSVEDFL